MKTESISQKLLTDAITQGKHTNKIPEQKCNSRK